TANRGSKADNFCVALPLRLVCEGRSRMNSLAKKGNCKGRKTSSKPYQLLLYRKAKKGKLKGGITRQTEAVRRIISA
ncbi:MAG: hypothetical protein KKG84_06155, partial [Candidatus Omnitrophica bacterium]|nr:hypothetical protein [Candidatus Omnitrophota bacterium]